MGDEFTLEDALIVLRRRLLLFLIPSFLLFAAGAAVVMLLPAQYTAQGTILVESAQIPSDFVRSTINAYAQERIQTIRQRVMTREKLLSISDKYNIFPRSQGYTDSERVQLMRSRVNLSLITAQGANSGGQRDGTIAFTVSYTDRSPTVAFQVANEFMTLFLSEDVRTRSAGASNTTDFFKEETARLATGVDAMEAAIAKYKSEHADALPEHLNMHLNALDRATRDLSTTEAMITSLQEELRFLETQIMSQLAGANSDNGPASELASLKSQLVQLRAVYHDAHPGVQSVKDQIEALERELAPNKEIQDLQKSIAAAELELKRAERDLEAGDPALAARAAEVEALERQMRDRIARQASATGGDFLTAQLQSRLAVGNNRMLLLEGQRDKARTTIAELEDRIARTPEVERGLQALTRDRENVFKEYQDVLAKQQEAQLAENLEDGQRAEKFSILEAAVRPEKSSSPDRPKLVVLALFVSLCAGVGLAIGVEFLFATVRGRNHLAHLFEAQPIAVIPYIKTSAERRRWSPFGGTAAKASAAAAAALVATAGTPDLFVNGEDNVNFDSA